MAFSSTSLLSLFLLLVIPILISTLITHKLDSYDPAPFPLDELTQPPLKAPSVYPHMLKGSDFIGAGKLNGPEEILYDSESGVIYTGCVDGWIKRVKVNDSDVVVEDWVNTGGRPLGLALGRGGDVIVADAYKGLLRINKRREVELLTNEAEGQKFKVTDGVDIAEDSTIYFTDASYKYDLHDFRWEVFEGRPRGRLLSYDPRTKSTKVLVHNLYFANGVVVSPNQDYVAFCETPMKRCRKYYIKGEKKGIVEKFIDNLPGLPDNINYDGEGHYWIALATEATFSWEISARFPIIRKLFGIIMKYIGPVKVEKNSGVFVVDINGKPTKHYCDQQLVLLSSALKIGDHLYCGSIIYPYIIRFNLLHL